MACTVTKNHKIYKISMNTSISFVYKSCYKSKTLCGYAGILILNHAIMKKKKTVYNN